MDLGLNGRQALIFGGSRGLGRACAEAIAAEGARVTIAGRTETALAAAAGEMSTRLEVPVRYVVADITTDEGRAAALAACPAPDILLNNASGWPVGDFRDWTHDDWVAGLDRMMLGPIGMIRLTVDGMMERGFGRIVNITSRSVKVAQVEMGLSNGARSGLTGFVAGLARQTIAHGVTINNILPGIFDSEAQADHIEGLVKAGEGSFEEIRARRARQNPAGRYGRPDELGSLFAWICGDKAGFMTGQNLLMDGGSYPGTF
ncbi:SDR family oxidoreductase [Pukyongiella litopenaei]|uniref:SDR family oxidoreductase n=1 Tax=Pukyongiella litopenaei TaxID=2605946 RepID=A0A2S0MS71_9RHOB|nr:SDR family oxidoreductase [Pukyongiella litopenaei]AVO38657.1 SDR family oxidoreductase [Pukyongiella litopenaei]